jgi:hypothetical protein
MIGNEINEIFQEIEQKNEFNYLNFIPTLVNELNAPEILSFKSEIIGTATLI